MDVTRVSVFYDVSYGELNPQLGSSSACSNRIGGRQLDFDCSGKTKNVNVIEINLVELAKGRVQWLDIVYESSERFSFPRVQWLEFVCYGSERFSFPRVQWLDFVYL